MAQRTPSATQISFGDSGFSEFEDVGLSPLRRQYLEVKRQHPEAILLFRLGDFYETFEDDARLMAETLEVALTSREMGKGERVAMAGIPAQSAESYIARLISAGHKVAVCDQIGSVPQRGLVQRAVVRVITPGTLIEDAFLHPTASNYLVALARVGRATGLAYADISAGDFAATESSEVDASELAAELARLRPAECLLPGSAGGDDAPRSELAELLPEGTPVSWIDPAQVSPPRAAELLCAHFRVHSLEAVGLAERPAAACAAAVLLHYLRRTQPAALRLLDRLHLYSLRGHMLLDAATRRNLELVAGIRSGAGDGSLLQVLDRTCSAMGARLLRRWLTQPLLDIDRLRHRQDGVEAMVAAPLVRARARQALAAGGDLERLAARAAQSALSPRECLALLRSLRQIPALREALATPGMEPLARERDALDDCADAAEAIAAALVDDPPAEFGQGVIRPGYSAALDELRALTGDARQWIASLERAERERTGIRSLKVGYNRVFGYYLEVSRAVLQQPTDYYQRQLAEAATVGELLERLGYQRRQSLAHVERFVTAALKEQEGRLERAQEEIAELERRLYAELCATLQAAAPRMLRTARAAARVDVLATLAEVAVAHRYIRPHLREDGLLRIVGGRHPVVEQRVGMDRFIPNDCHLGGEDGARIALITGPNMAGKSTYLRQVALIVLLAQIGAFVPATEAEIGLVDRIFTRVGAQDDIATGQSTFMVEMLETANILRHATPRSLVVLDEIGRGTSTYDGLAIARAVVEHLHHSPELGCKTLFATHYHELTALEEELPRLRNYRVDVLEQGERVVFLHRVVPGGADRSYGVHVARLAGVPLAVTRRAEALLRQLEAGPTASTANGREVEPPLRPAELAVLDAVRQVNVNHLTPLEALTLVASWQRQLHEEEPGE